MITKELVDFIKAQRASGKDDSYIRQSLLSGGGWEHDDVDEAISIAGPNTSAIPQAPKIHSVPAPTLHAFQGMPTIAQVQSSAAPSQSFAPSPISAPAPAPIAPPVSQAPVVAQPLQQATSPAPALASKPLAPAGGQNQWTNMMNQFAPNQAPVGVTPAQQLVQNHAFTPIQNGAAHADVAPVTSSKSYKGIIIVAILLLLVGGGGAYAYVGGFLSLGSKAPYSELNLLSGLLSKVSSIDAVEYKLSTNLRTVERESGAVPYEVDEKALAIRKVKFENDSVRINDILAIRQAIGSINNSNGYETPSKPMKYPASLAELVKSYKALSSQGSSNYYSAYYSPKEMDPMGTPYTYSRKADGSGYTLSIELESNDMIDALKRNMANEERYSINTLPTLDGSEILQPPATTPLKIEDNKLVVEESTKSFYAGYWQDPFLVTLTEYTKNAPLNMDFTGSIAGTLTYPKNDTPTDWRSNFILSGNFDDLSINVDVEAKKVEDDYYFIANKFPSFFYFSMLAPIKGKWVKITSDEATGNSNYGTIASLGREVRGAEDDYKENRGQLTKDLQTVARIADEQKLFAINGNPPLEEVDGVKAYRYDLRMRKETFLATMEKLAAEFSEKYGYVLDTEDIVSLLKTDESSYSIDYMSKNVFITLWVDKLGNPVKGDIRLRVVPAASIEHLEGKQIDLSVSISFANINDVSKVSAPKDFITAEEADELINDPFESSREKGGDAAIKSNTGYARSQAEIYYDNKNSYLGVCKDSTTGIASSIENLRSAGAALDSNTALSVAGSYDKITCHDSSSAWVLEAPLANSSAEYPIMWCVDSTGASVQKAMVLTANQTVCRQ